MKLGDEFLMSSLFTAAEQELATLGLAALDRDELDVVVGGLGLGYTAGAAWSTRGSARCTSSRPSSRSSTGTSSGCSPSALP